MCCATLLQWYHFTFCQTCQRIFTGCAASYSVKHTVAELPIIIATVPQVILRHVLLRALMCLVCWVVKHYLSCNTFQHSWHVIAIHSHCHSQRLLFTPSVWLPLLTCSAQMRWYVSRGGLWCIFWTVSLTTMPNIPVQKRRIDQSMYTCICPSWAVFLVMVMSTHDWSIPHVGHVQIIYSLTEDWLAPTARYMFHNCGSRYITLHRFNICLNLYPAPLLCSRDLSIIRDRRS